MASLVFLPEYYALANRNLCLEKSTVAGLPCITRLLTGRVATIQTLLFARTLPVVFFHCLFIELEITIVRALTLQFGKSDEHLYRNCQKFLTLNELYKSKQSTAAWKNWCGCLKRDLPLTKYLLHKAAVTSTANLLISVELHMVTRVRTMERLYEKTVPFFCHAEERIERNSLTW